MTLMDAYIREDANADRLHNAAFDLYKENQRLKEELAKAKAELERKDGMINWIINYIDGWKNTAGAPDNMVRRYLISALDPTYAVWDMYAAWDEAENRSHWDPVPRTP